MTAVDALEPRLFLFRIEELERVGAWNYAIPACTPIFRAVLEIDQGAEAAFRVFSGDFLLHNLAYRTSRAEFTGRRSRHGHEGVRVTRTANVPLYRTMVWDLCDALEEQWHTLDLGRLADELFHPNLFAISFSSGDHDLAAGIDARLASEPGYLGACSIDPGNPLHVSATLHTLPLAFTYARRAMLYDPWGSEDPLNPPPLNRHGDEWWSGLPFDAVRYATDAERQELALWPASELSDRGAMTAQLLARKGEPTHLERVATALTALRTDPEMPSFDLHTGAMPDAEHAIVEERKLTDYLLSETHEKGKHKARLFREVLGITGADWQYLAAQLREGLASAQVVSRVRSEDSGVKYHVLIPVRGRNGTVSPVLAAWEVRAGGPPRLTTAYLAPKDVDPETLGPAPLDRLVADGLEGNERWEALWRFAHEAGQEAGTMVVPTPMRVIAGWPGERTTSRGEWVPEGEIGSAWVTVPDLRTGFARWLALTGKAYRDHGRGAAVFAPYDGVQRAEAYARAFAAVLEANGVTATVSSRLD